MVAAHETGHIFYALDEYRGGDPYSASSGYYNTQNRNATDDDIEAHVLNGLVGTGPTQ